MILKLLNTGGGIARSGDFCSLMQIAIEEYAQKKFSKLHLNIPFKLDQLFTLEAFEGFNSAKVNGIEGKKLKEACIASILKSFWQETKPGKNYFLAIPPDEDADSIIIEAEKNIVFSQVTESYKPSGEVLLHPFQIKELRQKANIIDAAKKSLHLTIFSDSDLLQDKLFADFKGFIREVIAKKAYKGMALILFMRPPSTMRFDSSAINKEIRNLNNGYFSKIWLICPIDRLKGNNGNYVYVPHTHGTGQFFDFSLKEVVNDLSAAQDFVSISCTFKKEYFKRACS